MWEASLVDIQVDTQDIQGTPVITQCSRRWGGRADGRAVLLSTECLLLIADKESLSLSSLFESKNLIGEQK